MAHSPAMRAALDALDVAIVDVFEAIRSDDPDDTPPDAIAVDAVLLIGVQHIDDDDARIGYTEVVPRYGAQPAYVTRGLIGDALHLIDQVADAGDQDQGG
ncbi:hypothetical protein SEA_FLAGSTAFF_65 [Mycobacterium phage FlagStaff]|uniref:Uncharacterized protein n=1 Tax=Mycobacterium phage FlagStaff TaxID=1647304 RepID=A0A0F6SJN0_9CAUD|nr:hypothetical protein AVT49_gp65 [Mycobacterium phage FlagStaff]AKF14502.1 hypothetical protein SEA_FLAGSTAFF_65 [Mycobacterium phage FlagStaff]